MSSEQKRMDLNGRLDLIEALGHLNVALGLLLSAGRIGWANEIARYRNAIEKDLRRLTAAVHPLAAPPVPDMRTTAVPQKENPDNQ